MATIKDITSIETVTWAISDAVQYYGRTEGQSACQLPQTFVSITQKEDLELTSFGRTVCDVNKPQYFFSRRWRDNGYGAEVLTAFPTVAFYPLGGTFLGFQNKRQIADCEKVQLLVIDELAKCEKHDCANNCNNYCDSRAANEIDKDLKKIGLNILTYLSNCKLYHNENQIERLMPELLAQKLIGLGENWDLVNDLENSSFINRNEINYFISNIAERQIVLTIDLVICTKFCMETEINLADVKTKMPTPSNYCKTCR